MVGTSLEQLLRYVGFSTADHEALRSLHGRLGPADFKGIVDAFYDSIQRDTEARAVLKDDAQVERLKLSLGGWLQRMLKGPWDEDYARLRARIGRAHVQVRLPQRFMLTSMSVVRRELHAAVERLVDDRAAAIACRSALARILDVDLAVMLETYREDSLAAINRLQEVERKLLADELMVSEERYRAVLETAEVIAIAMSDTGAVRLFNRQAELVSGRTRTEVLDADAVIEIVHPSDRRRVLEAISATRVGRVSHVIEARMVNRAGESHVVRWHITALPPEDSGEVCLIGIDLTAERNLTARTRRAEQLATLGTLAAGLAHEIRNPLNAAQLQLTVAERRLARANHDDAPVVAEPIRIVRAELDRLATLVQDFLAYARPVKLRFRAIDLRLACESAIEFLSPVALKAGVKLTLRSGETVTAHCDEEQWRQVLLNLIKNAVESAQAGGGHVELNVSRHGPSAVTSIADDGPGVPDDIDVFEPFATSKEGGTGLGLPIVKRIVDQHDGSISIIRADERTIVEIEVPVEGAAGA